MPAVPDAAKSDLLSGLPGESLIRKGLDDWQQARVSVESCLVEIAGPRLARAGLLPKKPGGTESERTLYRLLSVSGGDPYSRYNALLRELVSFEHALDHRLSKSIGLLT
jgi:hypothetical protein